MNVRSTLAAVAALAVSACAGGGSSVKIPQRAVKTTAVQLSIVIPARNASSATRSPRFVSPGTQSGGITLNQFASVPAQSFDLSPNGPNCSSATGARTCTVTVDLPLGSDTIKLFTYDGALLGGQVSGHQLAVATATQTIVEGQLNSVVISLLGLPATVTITPQQSTISATGTPVTVPLTVSVYDASGNPITGLDPYSQPVVISASSNSLASADIRFSVNGGTPGGGGLLTHSGDTISLVYPGSDGTGPYMLNATIDSGNTKLGSAPFTIQPGFAMVKQVFSNLANADIEQRYDTRDIWLTEPAAHKIASITSAGLVEYPVSSGKEPRHIVFTGVIASGPGGGPVAIITELPDTIGIVAANGSITEKTVPTVNAGLGGVVYDYANFQLWFAESTGKIGMMSPGGASITEYPTGIAGSAPAALAMNNLAGGLIFTDPGTNAIGFMKADHTVVEYPIPTANAGPSVIVGGWFAESNAAKLGHIDGSGLIVEYPVPDVIVSLVGAASDGSGAALWALTRGGTILKVGADGSYQTLPAVPVGNGTPIVITQGYYGDLLILRSGVSVSDLDKMFY